MQERNLSIDFGRFLFAFLVVIIHVPIFTGGDIIYQYARCAVPFFYIVSGYYLYSSESDKVCFRLKKNIKKWFLLWVKYSFVFALLVSAVKLLTGTDLIAWGGVVRAILQMLKNGEANVFDAISYKQTVYGFSTLWFLHGGIAGFIIMRLLFQYLSKKIYQICVILLLLVLVSVQYVNGEIYIPRLLLLSYPFMTIGFIIHQYEDKVRKIPYFVLLVLFVFLVAVQYIEKSIVVVDVELYYTTIFLSVVSFLILLTHKYKVAEIVRKIPTQCTLDIYLWHRAIYGILSMIGVSSIFTDAISVFIISLSLSFTFRFFAKKYEESWVTNELKKNM